MLEHARAGERALLRDVADEQHRDAVGLGDLHDPPGDLAHLADRAGRAAEVGGVQRLDGVDDADLGALGAQRREDRVEVGLGEHGDLERAGASRRQPLGAQADLRRGLLAGDVERAPAGGGEVAERHVRQRRLADPRRAAEQHERAGHEAAAEHAVELADRRSAGAGRARC